MGVVALGRIAGRAEVNHQLPHERSHALVEASRFLTIRAEEVCRGLVDSGFLPRMGVEALPRGLDKGIGQMGLRDAVPATSLRRKRLPENDSGRFSRWAARHARGILRPVRVTSRPVPRP
jgi:hypothetical protein